MKLLGTDSGSGSVCRERRRVPWSGSFFGGRRRWFGNWVEDFGKFEADAVADEVRGLFFDIGKLDAVGTGQFVSEFDKACRRFSELGFLRNYEAVVAVGGVECLEGGVMYPWGKMGVWRKAV